MKNRTGTFVNNDDSQKANNSGNNKSITYRVNRFANEANAFKNNIKISSQYKKPGKEYSVTRHHPLAFLLDL